MLVKLGDLLTIKYGSDYKHLTNGNIPVIGTSGVMLYVNEYLYNKEAILLPRIGSLSNIMYINEPFWTVNTMFYAIPNSKLVNLKFLYYYLTILDLTKYDKGSVIPCMTALFYNSLLIDLPSLELQNKIACILSSIDNQIERNNLIVKKLQVLSQSIFNKFFSNENIYVSLLDFPYIQIIKPGINKFKGYKHYIATAEVDNDKVNYNAPLIEYHTRENRANMQPVKNSVWFAKMKNSIKHIYVSNVDNVFCSNYIFSTGFAGIKCEDIAFEYLINFINTPYFELKKNILSHGATMEGVNNDDLKYIQVPLPSKEKLFEFHSTVTKIHYQITKLNEQTYIFNNLKDKLLPLLINEQLI